MRIGPFHIGRAQAAAAAEPVVKTPPETVGASGTINYTGFLQTDEYNSELIGKQGLKVWDKMLRSDGSVQEALEHIFAPVKNATVDVVPPPNPSRDELVATALVRDAFFETLDQPFLEYLDQALDYLAKGHSLFETSWKIVERELAFEVPGEFDVDPDTGKRTPKTETVPARQWLVWDRFEERLQSTIYQWHQEGGKLQSVTQQVWDGRNFVFKTIPVEQLVVLTNKRRGDNFEGRPILRAAYKAWYLKELIERIEAVALERWGVNIVVGYLPRSLKDDAAALARLEDILANLKGSESTYVAMPGPKQTSGPNGDEGYLIELIGPQGTPPDFESAKEYHRGEIKAAVLARFAELGHAQTGARATGDTQAMVWFDALHAVARYLQDVHQPAIRRLVDFNLPGVTRYPKLEFSGIEARNLQEFAAAVASLVAAGAIDADRTFRGWTRDQIDAPPEDETDDTDPAAAPANPTEPADQSALSPAEQKRRQQAPPEQQQLPVDQEKPK